MRTLLCVAVVAALVAASGCAGIVRAPVVPPAALIYTGFKAPLDVDYDSTSVSGKKGTASCINVLGLVSVGDASARAAADEGKITTINHADYELLNVLFIFSKYTTVVYGN